MEVDVESYTWSWMGRVQLSVNLKSELISMETLYAKYMYLEVKAT